MNVIFGILLAVQAQSPISDPPAAAGAAVPNSVHATRAETPPALDGRDDDPVWRTAPVITQFLEARPSEGAAPRLRT